MFAIKRFSLCNTFVLKQRTTLFCVTLSTRIIIIIFLNRPTLQLWIQRERLPFQLILVAHRRNGVLRGLCGRAVQRRRTKPETLFGTHRRHQMVTFTACSGLRISYRPTIKYCIPGFVGLEFLGAALISVATPTAHFLFLNKSLHTKNLLNPLK